MSGYTKGPWIIDKAGVDNCYMLSQPACKWIAVGIADEDGYAESIAYCHSDNARLIAEAPAMREALERCFIALGRLGANFDTVMVGRREWEECRAILARIDGGQS